MRQLCRRERFWRGGCKERESIEHRGRKERRVRREERNRAKKQIRSGRAKPAGTKPHHAQLRASPEQSHRRSGKEEGSARDGRCERMGRARLGAGARGKDGPRVSAI